MRGNSDEGAKGYAHGFIVVLTLYHHIHISLLFFNIHLRTFFFFFHF